MIDSRLIETHFAGIGLNYQVAVRVDLGFQIFDSRLASFEFRISRFDFERNGLGVGAGLHDKVILQFSLFAVVDQVDAGIHVPVPNLGVGRDFGVPPGGIISDEVVGDARLSILSQDLRCWVAARQLHMHQSQAVDRLPSVMCGSALGISRFPLPYAGVPQR